LRTRSQKANSALLHELYFSGMAPQSTAPDAVDRPDKEELDILRTGLVFAKTDCESSSEPATATGVFDKN
jgi:hypothetical protein